VVRGIVASVPDPREVVFESIGMLLRLKNLTDIEVTASADLAEDLQLDSLDIAELSAILEDDLGRDPYSAGLIPRTVAELVAYYG
jgi:acyl carrier protein